MGPGRLPPPPVHPSRPKRDAARRDERGSQWQQRTTYRSRRWPTARASGRPAASMSSRRSRRSRTTRSCPTARSTALVAPSGNVEWMCLPRMDSPSVFGAILDRDAGGFRFGPADVRVPAGAALPARHAWCSRPAGDADGLAHRPRRAAHRSRGTTTTARPHTHRRAPTDYDAEHVLLRTVRCVNGEVAAVARLRARVRLRPRARRLGVHRPRLPPGASPRPRACDLELSSPPTCASGFEGRRPRPGPC